MSLLIIIFNCTKEQHLRITILPEIHENVIALITNNLLHRFTCLNNIINSEFVWYN